MKGFSASWLAQRVNPTHILGLHSVRTYESNKPKRPRKTPLMEPDLRDGALGEGETQGGHSGRFLVRVTSFRVRLLDEDNLCEKYHVDCCRYAGLIPGDAPGQAKIQTGQQKVKRKDQEHVLIEITSL